MIKKIVFILIFLYPFNAFTMRKKSSKNTIRYIKSHLTKSNNLNDKIDTVSNWINSSSYTLKKERITSFCNYFEKEDFSSLTYQDRVIMAGCANLVSEVLKKEKESYEESQRIYTLQKTRYTNLKKESDEGNQRIQNSYKEECNQAQKTLANATAAKRSYSWAGFIQKGILLGGVGATACYKLCKYGFTKDAFSSFDKVSGLLLGTTAAASTLAYFLIYAPRKKAYIKTKKIAEKIPFPKKPNIKPFTLEPPTKSTRPENLSMLEKLNTLGTTDKQELITQLNLTWMHQEYIKKLSEKTIEQEAEIKKKQAIIKQRKKEIKQKKKKLEEEKRKDQEEKEAKVALEQERIKQEQKLEERRKALEERRKRLKEKSSSSNGNKKKSTKKSPFSERQKNRLENKKRSAESKNNIAGPTVQLDTKETVIRKIKQAYKTAKDGVINITVNNTPVMITQAENGKLTHILCLPEEGIATPPKTEPLVRAAINHLNEEKIDSTIATELFDKISSMEKLETKKIGTFEVKDKTGKTGTVKVLISPKNGLEISLDFILTGHTGAKPTFTITKSKCSQKQLATYVKKVRKLFSMQQL